VPQSILDAIKSGAWDFDPEVLKVGMDANHRPTQAMPGTAEKLAVLCERVRSGLPLWHPRDRISYDNSQS